jgi:hypoxanthine phosphoribosyltransferase
MQQDVQRVLVDRDAIARRVQALGEEITRDLERDGLGGKEITLVPILTGSIIFVSDLIRCLPLRMQIHVMSVNSYPGTATTSQGATLEPNSTQVPQDLTGRHVLVMDDILDSGNTLRLVRQELEARGPATLRTCVMLRKQRPEAMSFPVDYVAFDIPDEFVVGYGLDYDDYYRNLPDIAVLKREVIEREASV